MGRLFFNIWIFTTMKLCSIRIVCLSRFKILPNTKQFLWKIAKDFWKWLPKVEISPNLVTLFGKRYVKILLVSKWVISIKYSPFSHTKRYGPKVGHYSVGPDLAKFCHFWLNFISLWQFLKVYLIFGKIVNLLWQLLWYWANVRCCKGSNIVRRIKPSFHSVSD